jgi:UDP-2,4-diacetamido-2,4,6-trideoxy-beta-L-altropyranose hydrolase
MTGARRQAFLVRADASSRIGAGHVMRCLALAGAARAAGMRTIFAACELPEVFDRRVRDEGHEVRLLDAAPCSDEDTRGTLKLADEADASVVAIDLCDGTPAYLASLADDGRFRTLCVDDNASLAGYPAHFVLNLNGHARAEHYRGKVGADTRLLLGPAYALLRREFQAYQNWQRPVHADPKSILLSLGGGNQAPAFVKIVERLAGVLPPFELSFVLARPDFDATQLEAAARGHGLRHRFVISPPDMALELSRHDALISSGGSSVWEALYMQTPAMFVAIAENQVNSCAALRGMIAHPVFLSINDIEPEALDVVMRDRALLARSGRSIVDGHGAGRVIGEICNTPFLCQNPAIN